MISPRRKQVGVAVGVVLVLSALAVVERIREGPDPYQVAGERQARLRELRARLEACRTTQDRIELRFAALGARTDGIREEIDALESLDPRGVPAEFYPRYLDLVAEFNAAVEEWDPISVDLRAQADRCRELIELHNAGADSLRAYLVESGIWNAGFGVEVELLRESEEAPPDPPAGPLEGSLPPN